jgi:hypothetical protein
VKQANSLKNRDLIQKKAQLEANIRRLERKYHKDSSVIDTCRKKTKSHPIPALLVSVAAGFLAGSILNNIGNKVGKSSSKRRNRGMSASNPGLTQFVADEVKRQIAQRGVQTIVEILEKRSKAAN